MGEPATVPLLSVVVPTYNHASVLRHALACLAAQTLAAEAYEVVVVDDGSTDETPAVIAEAGTGLARVRGVHLERNRGRSVARNEGIRAACAPIVVFIDSDVLVRPDFLQRHLDLHHAAGESVIGRGPVATIPTPVLPARNPAGLMSAAFLTTANASVPRQALLDAGLFDEGFVWYGWEDFDLGLRLRARGLTRRFSRGIVAFHVQPPSTFDPIGPDLAKEEARARSALYFLQKHPGLSTRILISDTAFHRALHFLLSGAGFLTADRAPVIARWLASRGFYTPALLAARGFLNWHYIRSLDRLRAREPLEWLR